MDTTHSKLASKQGTVVSADLEQQKPHVEGIDPKSPVVSSEEERLAKGISTIGLETKKLSGAQQRKLSRERKMREGTWTERKPPRRIPLSSDRSVVESTGGVKRPHSDLSTPTIETQQPKKPRNTSVQTGVPKEAVPGIKMVITHRRHPVVKLDQTQGDIIQAKLMAAVDTHPLEETPLQFHHSKFAQGVFWITCANVFSQTWLLRTVSELGEFWKGAELTVTVSKDLPKRPRVLVRIPDASEVGVVFSQVTAQNPGLDTTDWTVMSRKIDMRGQTLALSIDPDSFGTLTHLKFKAFWGLINVFFRTLKDDMQHLKDESSASKPPSQ
jgi:hypothetical protein